MELPEDIYEKIVTFSESGNEACEEGDFEVGVHLWSQALALLPEPASQWEAYMWLNASIADAQYALAAFGDARDSLTRALSGPDGEANGFVHYMMGKSLLKLEQPNALDHLRQAHSLEGDALFEADDKEGVAMLALVKASA